MQFAVLLATFASFVAISASPIQIQKRELGGILLCTGVNATGTCTHEVFSLNKCHQVPKPYYKNINTFAPDGEDFVCFPSPADCDVPCRSPTGCTSGSIDFQYAHKYNLGAIHYNKELSSFECMKRNTPASNETKA